MHRIDGPGATGGNLFTSGNPATGVPATTVTPEWLTAVQEEIMAILAAASIAPVKANNAQLLAAMQALGVRAASTAQTGVVQLATSAEAQALTNTLKAITPDALNLAFKGANQSQAAQGYQKLPGGIILQWGSATGDANGQVTWTYPIAFPNALGTALGLYGNPTRIAKYSIMGNCTTTSAIAFVSDSAGAAVPSAGCRFFAMGY